MSTITSVTLNNFIIKMCNKYSFSRAYFSNMLKVVKGSFREACNVYGFLKYNPSLTLRLPKMDKVEEDVKHLYTQEEIDKILKRFAVFTCAFLTSCFTGMRTGEVCALTWNDIDFKEGTIYVKHNVYDKPKDDKGRWYIGGTKTPTGTRKIYICQILLNALKTIKKSNHI